ncbi:MAG: 50S ribosomal protein L16 [Thermoplasmata archaeon HGW-Thermoplasmata-1]|nr:MAG: 50S ribosomal protein L16 [Thermoplasmata archaeon HGW-Thermoplasmata-1]
MPRKPGSMYRKITQHAYTRRKYMGGVPASRIIQFDVGNKSNAGNFPVVLSLVVDEVCQARHNCLEAARISANRFIEKKAGKANYHLKVRVYPHNVIRENKQATGAGADRVSQGMRRAFGKPVGTAARLDAGQRVISLETTLPNLEYAKEALRKAGSRLPSPCHVIVDKLEEQQQAS